VVLVILLGTLAAIMALVLAARDLASVSAGRKQVVAAVVGDEVFGQLPAVERYDRLFRATRLGRRMEREMILAGVEHRPVVVFAAGLSVAVVASILLWTLLAPLLALLGVVVAFLAVRGYLRRERGRRLEAFVAQMPELARVLANATSAGLSIHTAIGVAAEEMDEPARAEMKRVATRIGFGSSLDRALEELSERLSSREIAVLTSTLVVSARSGGSLVTALRDIADTLEARKETRREIRTTLSQALATGYFVIAMGVFILVILNLLYDGVVAKMTTEPVGQVALLVAGALYALGTLAIRRMTRFDL
jgi:tight adherence protein B